MFSQDLISSIPHSPGVYLMLDSKSAVLYVGKAKDLVKRLSSYSRFNGGSHSKTSIMLAQVDRVDTIITRTEKEALILEASLIKKHAPKYNIILRDDKNYPLIKVTVQEKWPRVTMARRRQKDGARYFGPYSSSSAMWATLRLISKLFPLRRCKGGKLQTRKRPCLNYQMGQCLAPCSGHADQKSYMDNVARIIMILEGKNKDLLATLERQMKQYSAAFDFERAAKKRDQISALSRTLEKQVVSAGHIWDQDVFGFVREDAAVAIAVLIIRGGLISGSRSYFLADPFGDDQAIVSQVLNQFYFHGDNIPKEIILPFEVADMELLAERFTELRQAKTSIIIPQRGDRTHLLGMAQTNAAQLFEEKEKKAQSWKSLSTSLIKKLKLDTVPEYIECLDISNLSGKEAVGSLVCFYQGGPAKERYRHYKIRTVEGPDDYAMMAEVLHRRFSRAMEEDNFPHLFMVDGGKGQLGMALRIARELGIEHRLDWLGIAKEKESEGEKLYKPGRKNPILLAPHDPVLLHLMRIRDESHRFGITFHRKLRNKSTLASELDDIPGIGPARKKQLLKTMGSLKKIKHASLEELGTVPGVGKELAEEIFQFFRQ
ncbi:excinuclease ABC subunit UvrC [Desulfopila inferna]|uniref:excinuclease ABC subunit UvrC n=1 Tax=Desulfopila inferna TaxID=468528 RepID=UPI0019658DAD|nr:excinuclease ABC subunit UvrC [Desulfopila inferna]MBM9602621.1 excinuclease ABC subunit UvrC [Desulfopila inferna]